MAASPSDFAGRPVALVGAGAVGRVLALRMRQVGIEVAAVVSRSRSSAEAVAREAGAGAWSDQLADVPDAARIVLLCTPDAAIPRVAAALAALEQPWEGRAVGHTAGALSVAPLAPLRAHGATPFALHPLQTVTRKSRPETLAGAYAGVEDVEEGGVGWTLAAQLGMRPVAVGGADRTRYHLAATLASNGLVALMGAVADVLATFGIERDEAAALMGPLLEGTLGNLRAGTPESALTGPVARGDAETVARHGAALTGELERVRPLYATLQREALRVAQRAGKLDAEQVVAVHRALGEGA